MREALAIFKKVLGEEHPNVAILLNKTAVLLSSMVGLPQKDTFIRGRKFLREH